jgi:hypothetical protein
MTDKPLHVQVAEVLGCNVIPRNQDCCSCHGTIPHYDTDWSATGPLIDQLHLTVRPTYGRWAAIQIHHPFGTCGVPEPEKSPFRSQEEGETPLRAVCNLILALHKAGKLP